MRDGSARVRAESQELVEALFDRSPFLMSRNRWNEEEIVLDGEGGCWTEFAAIPWGRRRALDILLVEDARTILVVEGGEEAFSTCRIR